MRDAIGVEPRRAGSKRNLTAASIAASSKPFPADSMTSTLVTSPIFEIVKRRPTVPSTRTSSAAGGYVASTRSTSFGGLITASDGAGAGADGGVGGGAGGGSCANAIVGAPSIITIASMLWSAGNRRLSAKFRFESKID
jgi:hypothetical protein